VSEVGEAVLDVQWHLGVDRPFEEPGVLQAPQCLGEHLGADALQFALQFPEALRAVIEGADGQARPLVAQQVQQRPAGAQLGEQVVVGVAVVDLGAQRATSSSLSNGKYSPLRVTSSLSIAWLSCRGCG
jgi:hypothetical protein